jgi:hypothetical protein
MAVNMKCRYALMFVAFAFAARVSAGIVPIWKVDSIATSPLLVVATVQSVEKIDPILTPRGQSNPARYWEATLLVHRTFRNDQNLSTPAHSGDRIKLRYLSFAEGPSGVNPPMWLWLSVGETLVFPIAPSGETGEWKPTAPEGKGLVVPALKSEWERGTPATTGQQFIAIELTNALANGLPGDQYKAAVYVRDVVRLPEYFRTLLEEAVGTNDDRWLKVAVAFLTAPGIPRPTVSEYLDGSSNRAVLGDVDWTALALLKGARRDYPNRLIRVLVRDATAHYWGSAGVLVEFKNSPVLRQELTSALRERKVGTVYIAWTLARNQQTTFVQDAILFAQNMIENRLLTGAEAITATMLVRDFGSDTDFNRLLQTLRRFQIEDETQFRTLANYASSSQGNMRELRIAEVLISDKRLAYQPNIRYCDMAVSSVNRLTGKRFVPNWNQYMSASTQERDQIVKQVAEWLKTNLPK